ncbi:MAG TPA: leucine-rich repeat protein [Pseudomonadales bacterium]|nr:leucine-rich repeat protein [Pseudomonadales bacterium]
MKMNIFLRYVCIAVLSLLAVPAAVRAQFTVSTNHMTGAITITGYTDPGGTVMIPNYYTNNAPLTGIGTNAFANCTNLTAIAIGSGVTNIGALAFSNCINLRAAYFSGNAPIDAGNAFYGDTNAVVYYLAGTTYWGPTFGGAPTMAETQPSTIEYTIITNYSVAITAWGGTNAVVVLPATINNYPNTFFVTGIGNGTEVPWGGAPPVTSIIIPYTVTNIANAAFPSFLTNVFIPNSVLAIGAGAFQFCGLTSVTIPNSITSIAIYTFQGCNKLTSVTIPNSINSIGGSAFRNCHSLAGVTIPGSVTNIGDYAFANCATLTSAYFQGNAPPDDGTVFSSDPAIVYYLPGTTGWGPTFGGVPTELWNPQATAFTMAGGQFGFNITGPTNATIVVESCTNLVNPVWLPVSTNMLSGSGTSSFIDPQLANFPRRFYGFSWP